MKLWGPWKQKLRKKTTWQTVVPKGSVRFFSAAEPVSSSSRVPIERNSHNRLFTFCWVICLAGVKWKHQKLQSPLNVAFYSFLLAKNVNRIDHWVAMVASVLIPAKAAVFITRLLLGFFRVGCSSCNRFSAAKLLNFYLLLMTSERVDDTHHGFKCKCVLEHVFHDNQNSMESNLTHPRTFTQFFWNQSVWMWVLRHFILFSSSWILLNSFIFALKILNRLPNYRYNWQQFSHLTADYYTAQSSCEIH